LDAEEAGAVGGGGAAHEELETAGKVKLVAEAELVGDLFDRGGFGQESARGVFHGLEGAVASGRAALQAAEGFAWYIASRCRARYRCRGSPYRS
jgi:hypothetical protein